MVVAPAFMCALLSVVPDLIKVPMTSVYGQTVAVETSVPPWSPIGVSMELLPIARLESGFGRNVNHAKNSRGEFYTAFGALGFKPMTAHDEYIHSPDLQKHFPGLENPEEFSKRFYLNNDFYNTVANHHFNRLKQMFGDRAKAVFGWRWGMGAAELASDDEIADDPYVQKYFQLTNVVAYR